MASELDHIALANRNDVALRHLMLRPHDSPEWIATVAFYKAVHVVEAVLAAQRLGHSNSHFERLTALKAVRFRELFRQFRPLYQASRIARYMEYHGERNADGTVLVAPIGVYTVFTTYLPPDEVEDKLIRRRLLPLENVAVSFLSPAGRAALIRTAP